jgi:acyl transferase domain-containing protein/acyl carrier protein
MSEFQDRITKLSPKRLALLALELQSKLDAVDAAGSEPLAIIGVGCRFPGGADSPDAFWRLLRRGGDGIIEVPRDRWDVGAYYDPDPDAPGRMSTRFGGFIGGIDRFDAEFFGITPREAASMDPQQRLLLEVAWEALEDAGQAPDSLAGSATGVFVGVCNADYFQNVVRQDPAGLDAYVATGGAHSVAAGRVAYVLGLQGPNLAVDTACSSSLVAVHLACQSLRNRECRMALAGGVNLILSPEVTIILSRAHMMAPDGRCKAFDARADGFVRAEGAGLVVLKRLSDAQADGDEVLAVIRGTAVNQDGRSNGLTAPNGAAQEAVVRSALANARVAPHEIAYVEAHGTGTSLGDPIELRALGAALGAGRAGDRPVVVGSLKTNIGHLEPAAGVAGLIKVVLALRHGEIPAQLHFETPNPHIPWSELPVTVATHARPWPAGRRLAGVSSFGFSGTNAHVIVEAAPVAHAHPVEPERPAHLLTLSARNELALRALAERWGTCLAHSSVPLAALCATARTGRASLEHRVVVTAATAEQARESLLGFARAGAAPGVLTGRATKGRAPEVAFLFTGQGAQYPGMGRALYDGQPAFRAAIDRCDAALRGVWEPRLNDVLSGASGAPPLDDTTYTQVALFAVEWALAELWKSWGVSPGIVVGHSVGEYTAACVAGVLELEEAIRMLAARGRLMGALPPGGVMVGVAAGEARVREALKAVRPRGAEIAAVNGPESVVVAGESNAVAAVTAELSAQHITCQPLRVSHAFHTALMEPMQAQFEAAVADVAGRVPRAAMVSTVTGEVVKAGSELDGSYWVRQVREPVRFAAAMETVRRMAGEGLWVEIGPHPVLTGLGQPWLAGGEWVPTLRRGHDDWTMILRAVGTLWTRGVSIDWSEGNAGRKARAVAGLPTYPFQRERHWLERTPRGSVTPAAPTGGHPLLGTRIRSATPIPHFEVQLTAQSPAFLADHRVHGLAIFPSPAQMEMAAAAATTVLGDERPLLVDFSIEQPLVLPADAPLPVQTVVTPENAGSVSISIVSLEDESNARWRVHARSTARRRTPEDPAEGEVIDLVALRARCPDAIDGPDYYAMAVDRGLEFGPSFEGITRLGRGDREALAEILVPAGLRGEQDRYRVHPAVLDACLQTLGGALPADDGETYLLVGADRISLPPLGGPGIPRWSHARLRSADPRAGVLVGDVRVLDAEGRTIASVEGIQLRRAQPESLARHRTTPFADWMYRVTWTATPSPSEAALPSPDAVAAALEPQVSAIASDEGLSVYDSLLPALESLSYQYVLRAFADLGWAPAPGEHVETVGLAATLGVEKKRHRLVARLLGILAEEGVLRRDGSGWLVATPAPAPDVGAAERDLAGRFPSGAAEITVTMDCGRALAAVLRGESDPLHLLFSPATRGNTESLYTSSPAARTFNALVARAVATAIGSSPRARRVRILEIGAGTGGTTNAILPALPEDAVEYVFTDVSPAFTTRAAERLRAPHRAFRPLDIERDPAEQGMAGERFDVVVAANVVHATRDLRRTLAHAKSLLAPGGLLILLEGTTRYRWVDLTFGLTDGWWHFADSDLRPDHALLPAEQWIALLEACGFVEPRHVPARPSGRTLASQAVLVARAPAAEASPSPLDRDWLVVADRGDVGCRLASALEERLGDRVTVIHAGADPGPAIRTRPTWHAVIDLRALDASPSGSSDVVSAATMLCERAIGLVRALSALGSTPRLWWVTRGAQPVAEQEVSTAVAQAPLWGLGRVVALEQPALWGGLIDIDPTAAPATAVEHIVRHLADPDEEDQVAFRDGQRYVPRLVRDRRTPGPSVTIRADGTYLLTGGLGRLGLKVARWLVEQGARHLVLMGRRGLPARETWDAIPATDEMAHRTAAVAQIEALGAEVDVVIADVADRSALTRLFGSFGSARPPLRGIVHAAADVRGEPLSEATAATLGAVFAPKVAGGWLLHELSRDLPLDFCVLFSSTTSLLGSGRLGYYAAANQFLDALAHHRRTEGLPALSVNWGTWDEMRGVSDDERRAFAQAGLLPMRSEDALEILGYLAGGSEVQATVAAVDWQSLISLYELKRPRPLLAELRARPAVAAAAAGPRSVELPARLLAAPAESRRDLVLEHVRGEVASVLGLDPARVDVEQGLFDMGMDSLMAVDLKARLEAAVGQRLSATLTFNYPTVTALTGYLTAEVLGVPPEPDPAAAHTTVRSPAPAPTLDDLTEDELAMLLAEKLGRIR